MAEAANNERALLLKEIEQMKAQIKANDIESQARQKEQVIVKPKRLHQPKVISEDRQHQAIQEQVETTEFDKRPLQNKNFDKWIKELIEDKFERLSTVETQDRKSSKPEKSRERSSNKREKTFSLHRGRSKKRDHERSPTRSIRSVVSKPDSIRSIQSIAKSVKSVLFRRTEEEELMSEIDDDDVADRNAGEVGFIDYTYEKFTIHGPFIDKELNVFHAICTEYVRAAKISFAKRSPFARTNPASDRIYALIGSNRRSSWTNRGDWNQITNDLQILDFIFRKTIRSQSRMIRQPMMELEHFTEGTELNMRRFWRIMKSIFYKRDRLLTALEIDIIRFEEIK